jgi:pyridoxine 4-dehydrogenase
MSAAAAGSITIGGDLTVNRLGLGAMRIPGRGYRSNPDDRAEGVAVLRRAVDLGIDFIDTADAYGWGASESLIAEALHPYPAGLVIATKGGLVRGGPEGWGVNGRPEHLTAACEASLQRLRLEQLPLYQYHSVDPSVTIEESVGALAALQTEGKVRHIGLSNVSVDELRRAQAVAPIASVQSRYNLTDRSSDPVLVACERDGVAFLPWAPIQDLPADGVVGEIAARYGTGVRQVALAWLLARSPAMLLIPGTSSIAHLEDNVAAAALRLGSSDVTALTSLG